MNDQSEKLKPGFVGYHKATMKRCVTKHPSMNGKLAVVTTEDGKIESYAPEELWTEAEWEARNANIVGAVSAEPEFDPYN